MGGYSSPSTPTDEEVEVEANEIVRPIGRKAAKRKLHQNANNVVVDLVTNHFFTIGSTLMKRSKYSVTW